MNAFIGPCRRVGAIAIVAVLAGCGGSSGAPGTSISGFPASSVLINLDSAVPGAIAAASVKRYSVAVTSGAQYVASVTGISGEADLKLYSDNSFSVSVQVGCAAPNAGKPAAAPEDCTVTATSGMLYLTVSNPGAANNDFRVRVAAKNNAAAASEGTTTAPLALNFGVPHPGSVDALASAASYYTVTTSGPARITLTGLQATQDVDVSVFSGADFATGAQTCSYAGLAGSAPEECALASGGTWYVQVTNRVAGVGGAYLLSAD